MAFLAALPVIGSLIGGAGAATAGAAATGAAAAAGIGSGLTTALTIGSTALGVVGSLASASAQQSAANYQARIGMMNAQIAEDNARRATDRSQYEAMEQDTLTMAQLGEQVAAQSASGLSLGGRSQMLTRKSAIELGRKDALKVREAGQREAENFRIQAANETANASANKAKGSNAMLAGYLNAGTSLISGARSLTSAKFDRKESRQ